MLLRRILLSPFTLLHGIILSIRHALFDIGVFKSTRPAVPTIAIGNLALGGTGKTPMMELVLLTLNGYRPLATLSRGYGRRTTGIHEVSSEDGAERSGDEPLQVKEHFPDVHVYVGADRVKAIAHIQQHVPGVRAIVLDDALQHRRLNAGLNILLTTARRPYPDDALMPAGRLRDLRTRSKAAQIVVVTKCSGLPAEEEQRRWRERLALAHGQELFFAGITYDAARNHQPAEPVGGPERTGLGGVPGDTGSTAALLFTGIADPQPLVLHLQRQFERVEHIAFRDHHAFTPTDLRRLADVFSSFATGPKTLITTEKDAMRLRSVISGSALEGLPLAVIGMRTVILNEPERFADLLRRHVATHPTHR